MLCLSAGDNFQSNPLSLANSDLFDAGDSSDDDGQIPERVLSSEEKDAAEGDFMEDSDVGNEESLEEIKNNAKKCFSEKRKTEGLQRTQKSRQKKEEALRQIHAETQRLVRESNVSLPYHKPKPMALKEFLNRKKKIQPLKYTTSQIREAAKREKCQQREADCTNYNVAGLQSESTCKEITGTFTSAHHSQSVSRLQMTTSDEHISDGSDKNLCLQNESKQKNVQNKTDDVVIEDYDELPDLLVEISSTRNKELNDNDHISNYESESVSEQEKHDDTAEVEVDESPVEEKKSKFRFDDDTGDYKVTNSYDTLKSLTNYNSFRSTRVPEGHSASNISNLSDNLAANVYNTSSSASGIFSLSDNVAARTAKLCSVSTNHLGNGQSLHNHQVNNDNVKATKSTTKLSCLKLRVLKNLAPSPCLSGSGPSDFIDLGLGDPPCGKPKGVTELMNRFVKHTAKRAPRQPHNVEIHVVHKEVDVSGQEHLRSDALSVSVPGDEEAPENPQLSFPGAKLAKLRESLKMEMKQKRQVSQQKKIQLYKMDNEEDYEAEGEDDEEEEAEQSETDEENEDEEEEEDIEEIPITEKKRPKNAFVESECEEEDGDDVGNDDDDDEEEDDNMNLALYSDGEEIDERTEESGKITNSKNKWSPVAVSSTNTNVDLFGTSSVHRAPAKEDQKDLEQLQVTLSQEIKKGARTKSDDIFEDNVARQNVSSSDLENSFDFGPSLIPPHQPGGGVVSSTEQPKFVTPLPKLKSSVSLLKRSDSRSSEMSLPIENSQDLYDLHQLRRRDSSNLSCDSDSQLQPDCDTMHSQLLDEDGFLRLKKSTLKKSYKRNRIFDNDENATDMDELLQFCSGQFTGNKESQERKSAKNLFGSALEDKQSEKQRKVLSRFESSNKSDMDELIGLCSGNFTDTQMDKGQKEEVVFRGTSNPTNDMDELVGLCSGTFSYNQDEAAKQSFDSQSGSQCEIFQGTLPFTPDLSQDDNVIKTVNEPERPSLPVKTHLGFTGMLNTSQESPLNQPFAKNLPEESEFVITAVDNNDDEEPIVRARKKRFKAQPDATEILTSGLDPTSVPSKRKRLSRIRLTLSDDESDDGEIAANQNYDGDVDDDNSLHAESENKDGAEDKCKFSSLQRHEFFEEEAELSGSEAESDEDLDIAAEDDVLEEELGDLEEMPSDEELRDQINRVHVKGMMDEDKREIRLFQEAFLEDGDLWTGGKGRQRQFRWKNVDDDGNDDSKRNDSDDADDNENDNDQDSQWRKARFEREQWLQDNKIAVDNAAEEENSQLLKLANKVLLKSKERSVSQKQAEAPSDEKKKTSATPTTPSKLFRLNSYKGSFLSRGKDALSKLAVMYSKGESNLNGPKNSGNFVFAAVSPDTKVTKAQVLRRSASMPAASQPSTKKPRLEPPEAAMSQSSIFDLM